MCSVLRTCTGTLCSGRTCLIGVAAIYGIKRLQACLEGRLSGEHLSLRCCGGFGRQRAPRVSAGPVLSLDDARYRGPDEIVATFGEPRGELSPRQLFSRAASASGGGGCASLRWRTAAGAAASAEAPGLSCGGRRIKRLGTERLNESCEGGDGWRANQE